MEPAATCCAIQFTSAVGLLLALATGPNSGAAKCCYYLAPLAASSCVMLLSWSCSGCSAFLCFYFGKMELDSESLIFKVEKYPVLYDTSDECYKNRNMTSDA